MTQKPGWREGGRENGWIVDNSPNFNPLLLLLPWLGSSKFVRKWRILLGRCFPGYQGTLTWSFPDFRFPIILVSWLDLRFLDFEFARFWTSQILSFPDFKRLLGPTMFVWAVKASLEKITQVVVRKLVSTWPVGFAAHKNCKQSRTSTRRKSSSFSPLTKGSF